MNNSGERNCVALGDKPRRLEPHDHILARHNFVFRGADLRVDSHPARGGAPGRKVVRQINFHGGAAVGACYYVRLPECRIFKVFSDCRLDQLAFVLEVCKLI